MKLLISLPISIVQKRFFYSHLFLFNNIHYNLNTEEYFFSYKTTVFVYMLHYELRKI